MSDGSSLKNQKPKTKNQKPKTKNQKPKSTGIKKKAIETQAAHLELKEDYARLAQNHQALVTRNALARTSQSPALAQKALREKPGTQSSSQPPRSGQVQGSPIGSDSYRVLLVDDNEIVAGLTALLLQSKGYQVLRANNGQEGLDLALREQPDIVLCCLELPMFDGIKLGTRLRKERPELPLIALSCCSDKETLERAQQAGFSDYLAKPFFAEELMKVIFRVLGPLGQPPSLRQPLD